MLIVTVALAALFVGTLVARRRAPVPEPPPFDVMGAGLAAAASALRDSADDEPRARVVAAYAAFEEALAEHGVARGASGTPTRLLEQAVAQGAPEGPAAMLTTLFGAARFGADPVTATDVVAAEQSLDTLLAAR